VQLTRRKTKLSDMAQCLGRLNIFCDARDNSQTRTRRVCSLHPGLQGDATGCYERLDELPSSA
jgi:hypothetical protein